MKKELHCIDFNGIASGYDWANTVISFGMAGSWRRRLIGQISAGQGFDMLDLASGTGDIAILAASRFPQARISAVDISEQMLMIAKAKSVRHKINNINWITGNMQDLSFPDSSFDVVTVAFGLRNASEIEKAISEISRVLRPGGRALILEFSMPGRGLSKLVFDLYFRWFMPVFGRLVTGNRQAYWYLYQSVKQFYQPAEFSKLLNEHGLANQPESVAMSAVWLYKCQKRR